MEETTVQEVPTLKWVVIPMTYEKWRHPGSKEKHYRAVFRNARGVRRVSKTKFKTATAAMQFANTFHLHLCPKRREVNDTGNNI